MKKALGVLAILICTSLSFSCAQRLGWGVVIWSYGAKNSGYIASGTLVPVYIRSNITKTYVVGAAEGKSKLELPIWQVRFFPNKGGAEKYAKEFSAFSLLYAVTILDGIEVKLEPAASGGKLYRLKELQVVKLLGKVPEGTKLKNGKAVKGLWYEVLTDDGTTGFISDEGILVYDESLGGAEDALNAVVPEKDSAIDMIFAKVWRPESFERMIEEGQYDLDEFSSRYGLFADEGQKQLKLELTDLSSLSQFTAITKLRQNVFKFEGTSIQIQVRNERTLTVQYIEENGASKSFVLVDIGKDIDAIVLAETERRQAALDLLVSKGLTLKSSSYGILKISANGRFSWTGYELLSPDAIPKASGQSGALSLRLYPGEAIRNDCAGILSFHFDGSQEKSYVDFIYRFTGKGVQLEYSPPVYAKDLVVTGRSSNPIVAYFEKAAN